MGLSSGFATPKMGSALDAFASAQPSAEAPTYNFFRSLWEFASAQPFPEPSPYKNAPKL